MDADKQLKEILHMAIKNAVSWIETLEESAYRCCVFNKYKEWLAENIIDEVWGMDREEIQNDFEREPKQSF
tara:strand:+ start:481 stop:693 length:213 start_codon:yes stop_codon:yes gene_type:complete